MKKLSKMEEVILRGIEVEEMVVTEDTINIISAGLQLENKSEDELIKTRNAVVKFYSKQLACYYNEEKTKRIKPLDKFYDDTRTKSSMVTAVIDNFIFTI